MNVKEYIESGILEAYVLGALPVAERAQVEADIAMYPELAEELAAIEQAMQQFAEAHAVQPPTGLQDQVWDAIEKDSSSNIGASSSRSIPVATQAPAPANRQPGWVRAAIWAAIFVSVITNFILLSQRNETREDKQELAAKIDSMATQQDQLAKVIDAYQAEREMLSDPATVAIKMNSLKEDKSYNSIIFWNKETKEAYVALNNLPVPPAGKQYQLWVIQDGKPVSMGMIPDEMVAEKGMMKVPASIGDGQAFAISLEQDGGNPTPTMEEIHVLGAVSS